jgi:hypothetical protein
MKGTRTPAAEGGRRRAAREAEREYGRGVHTQRKYHKRKSSNLIRALRWWLA